jgi:hypothetical protein
LRSRRPSIDVLRKDDEARDAAAEYARWIRDRDRRCRLAGKDNLPLAELSSSQDCLENYLKEMKAGMLAAKGDPKRVFLGISLRHGQTWTPSIFASRGYIGPMPATISCG